MKVTSVGVPGSKIVTTRCLKEGELLKEKIDK